MKRMLGLVLSLTLALHSILGVRREHARASRAAVAYLRLPMSRSALRAILGVEGEVSSMTVAPVPGRAPVLGGSGSMRIAAWPGGQSDLRQPSQSRSRRRSRSSPSRMPSEAPAQPRTTGSGSSAGSRCSAGCQPRSSAFALAVAAKAKHERWALLWLPLFRVPGAACLPGARRSLLVGVADSRDPRLSARGTFLHAGASHAAIA